jgi:hypothetical protein
MAKKLNLNQSPYFDDHKNSDKYYQILFRPGRAVQARELTQLQTLLQSQVERFGTHIFKQGSNVIPGTSNAVRYTRNVHFIKLSLKDVLPEYSVSEDIHKAIRATWVGKTIRVNIGDREGLTASIIDYRGPDSIGENGGEIRFFLNIITGSSNGEHSTFAKGDTVQLVGDDTRSATIPSTSGKKVGTVASVQIQEGVYFYNGYFVYVDAQTHFIAPGADETSDDAINQELWNDVPTASVGLLMTESIKTFQDDPNLLDNALGSPNYSAPGADRFHIDAQLTQISYNATASKPDNFITLVEVLNGQVAFIVDAPDYGTIVDTLARRTYDESGDYVVEGLNIELKEFLRDEQTQNNGAHNITEFQFTTAQDAAAYALKKFGVNTSCSVEVDGVEIFYPGTSYDDSGDATSFKALCDSFLTLRIDAGKAYVKGYEIRKIAKSSVDVPKSRTTRFIDQKTVETELGRYILVNDVVGNITFPKFVSVDLYDARRVGTHAVGTSNPKQYTYASTLNSAGTKIGTARLVAIEPDATEGAGYYRAYLTDIELIGANTIASVKTIHSSAEGIFAHVSLVTQDLIGTITSAAGTTTGTGTKWKNDASQLLRVNDYVYADSTQEYYRVVSLPTSDTAIVLKTEDEGTPTISASSIFVTYTQLESSTNETGLIYKLADSYVSSVRTQGVSGIPATTSENQYTIDEYFTDRSVDQTTKKIEISVANVVKHTFVPNEYTYKVIRTNGSTKTIMKVESGASAPSTDGTVNVSSNLTNKTLTFSFTDNDAQSSIRYDIVVPVVKTNVIEKKKVLRYGSFDASGNYTHAANPDSFTPTTANPGKGVKVVAASNNSEIHLDDCDVFRITRIVASKNDDTEPSMSSTLNDGDVDVTALYRFDNGQTPYEYGTGSVYLQASYKKLTGKVRVEYDYFDHQDGEDAGDFFTVNSYTHESGINYNEIPTHTSSDGIQYMLSDCLDFRRKASVEGVAETKSGRAPKGFLTIDYFAYNGRRDKVVLDSKTKNFTLSMGVADDEPVDADDIDTAMTLVELSNDPYGIDKNSCILKVKDNRRYTMRDIGKLERRIENLEYYTALSLLEQETSRMSITDANGNVRFKNGFLVDSFNSFESADTNSPDFSCSIDITQEHVARPLVTSDNFKLEEDLLNPIFADTIDTLRLGQDDNNGYQKTGELYTLPYTRSEFISQPLATKVVSVNPYDVLTYVGQIDLFPWSDEWRETKYSEILVYDDSAYQAARKLITGDINYSGSITSVVNGPKSGKKKTGRLKMLEGGHVHFDKLTGKEKELARKTKKFKVPKGYLNEGEIVDINLRSGALIQRQTKETFTRTTTSIRLGMQSELVKTSVETTKALTKDETTQIEFMRSREITFTGKAFRPSSNLYAYFDDVPVSEHCRPVAVKDSDNWVTYTATDTTNTGVSGQFTILPIDSPVRYFKIVGASTDSTFNVPSASSTAEEKIGKVRVGCEVQVLSTSGVVRKFEIERISSDNKVIICREKTQEGLLASQAGALGASGNITIKISKYAYGDKLKADSNGSIAGVFKIPNRDGLRFKTGEAKFVLSSSSKNTQRGLGITRAQTDYVARGVLNTQEMTITQTQQFVVTSHLVNPESVSSKPESFYDYEPPEVIDPIAQTFRVDENGGCYITDIDVFFANKPANNAVPVRLELRTVALTGIPEAQIIGGNLGTVIKTADQVVVNKVDIQTTGSSRNNRLIVQVDAGVSAKDVGGVLDTTTNKIKWSTSTSVKSDTIKLDNTNTQEVFANTEITSSDMSSDMVPTRFTFNSPIYLEQGKSYAFVLLSDSSDYQVWVAQSGQYEPADMNLEYGYYSQVGDTNVKIGTTDVVTNKQLYFNGGFFKSKNGMQWDLASTVSMKFNLSKAKFKTRADTVPNVGEITYVNETVAWTELTSNALEVRPNSKLIRVLCPNHGTSIGDRVRFSIDSDSSSDTDLRGFSKAVLQDQAGLKVVNAEADYFTVETTIASSPGDGYKARSTLTQDQYKMCPVSSDGKPTAFVRIDKRFDNLTLITNTFCPTGTSVQWVLQTTPAVGVNEFESNGSLVERSDLVKTSPINLVSNVPVDFYVPMKLQSPENEQSLSVEDASGWSGKRKALQDRKSAVVRALLISDNENLSPVIDKTRLSATTLSTRLDNPRGVAGILGNNINLTSASGDFDTLSIFNNDADAFTALEFTNSTVVLTGSFTQETNSKTVTTAGTTLLSQVNPGDKIVDLSNPTEERTVVKVVNNTKMILNAPFNAPLASSSLALVGEFMEITTQDTETAQLLSQLDSGKYATFAFSDDDDASIAIADDSRQFQNKLILNVFYTPSETVKCKIIVQHLNDGTTSTDAAKVTMTQLDRFVDEIAYEGGSCASKYVCKKLNLDRPSNALKLTFDAVRDQYSEIDLYYRIEQPNDNVSIFDKNWTKATYNIDMNGVLTPKTPEPSDALYRAYEATIEGLQEFSGVQAKIVMRGGNPAKPPKIKNFRLIALDE